MAHSLWDPHVPSGKMTVLGNQGEEVLAVAFSPDGKTVTSGDLQGVVRLWDVATGKPRHDFTAENSAWVFSLQFARDGNSLVVTDGGELHRKHSIERGPATTRLWDIAGGKPLLVRTWANMSHHLFSPDGKALALTGREGGAVWDLKADSGVARFPTSWLGVSPVAFSPDSKTVLVGSKNESGPLSTLRLLDADTGETRGTYEGVFGDPMDLQLTAAGRLVVVGLDGNKVLVVHATLGRGAVERQVSRYWGHRTLAFSPVANLVALIDDDHRTVNVWDLESGKERPLFKASTFAVDEIGFSADGKSLFLSCREFEFPLAENNALVMSYPMALKVLDVATGKERITLRGSKHGMVNTNGKVVAAGGNDETVTLHDLTTGAKLATLKGARTGKPKKPNAFGEDSREVRKVHLSPGGRWALGKTEDGVVTLWDAAAGKVLRTWQPAVAPVNLTFAPDEKTLLTADKDGTVRVLDLPALKVRAILPKAWLPGGACAFTRDGRIAAVVSSETVVKVLDLVAGAERTHLAGHLTAVTCVTWSPDGKTLATGTAGGGVQCWDPVTGKSRLSLEGHTHKVNRLAFSPDGGTLVTADEGGRLRVWSATDVPPHPELAVED
jgi:WD40 repeat protein